MSDLYGNLGSSIEKARTDKTGLYGDMGAVEEARAVTSFQGIPVQAWEYDLISKQIASAEERGDGDEKYRIASALQYSRLYGKPLSDTYQNLEAYNLAFLGEGYTPKTAPKAVADSLSIGWYTQRMNDLGNRIALSGGSDEALLSQYDELEKLTNGLADNVENRSLFVEALKAGAQSVPYMLQSGAVGALAVGAGAALTAATGGLSATAAAALFKFGSGLGSAVGTSGLEYMRMRKNGVDHDAAAALAALSAGAQGAIEVCLGADAAVAGLLTSGQLKTISGNVAKKVFVKGVWPTIAARAGLRLAGETFEEGVEEGLQSFTSSAADYIAAEIMETRGVKVDRDSLQKVLSDAMESAKMGALAAPVFGILSGPFEARADYQALRGMKEYAKATDRETFKQEAAENPAVKEILDTIPEEKQGEALDQVWQNAQAEVKKESEKAKPQAGKPEYLNGALYTAEQSLHERADGTVEAILKTGSPKTGERYGYLRYELQPTPEGGRQILLKGAGIKEEYASVGPELMVELAAKHPGIPIVTTEGSTERARSLVEQMGKVNPRGQEAGAQWFSGEENDVDSMAKARLRASLVEYIPNASSAQVEVGVLMHEMRANALGLGMSDYLQKHFQADLFSRDEAKLQDEWGKAKVAAEVEGAGARAGIAFDKDARAIIYVAKNANFKSFVHESSHAFRRQAAGTELGKRIDEAYGIVGGTWTRDREEAFTEDFLRWASYGEVRHEGLRGVFEQLGKWLVRLWNAVSSREQVKPEIAGIFNELFAAEKSPLAAIQAQGGAETASEVSTASPTPAEAQEGTLEPRAEAQEDFGEVPEVSPTTTLAPSEHPVAEIPVSEIVLSEDVPNFKEGANATTGAVEPLKAGHYERLGTAPIVVWERTNGKKEVITGRHRLDLARRTGETTIPAQVVREADGFTKEKAATFDAEANIRDGQGSVRDYANYFRNSDISREEASRRGLLSRDKGRAGFAIGRYAADGLYSLFRAGQIGEKKAAAIAEAAPNNDALQALGIKKARDLSAEELFNYVSLLAQSLTGSEASQADLFGSDDSLLVEAEKIAKEASAVLEGLVNEKRALEGAKRLGKADRLAILEKYGVKAGDEAAMQARIEELEGLIEEWENWTTDPGKIRELRKRLGMPVKEEAAAEESVSEDTETPMMFERDDLFGENPLSESAVRTFGLTSDPAEAGYVLPDGRMLDFSGKNQLGKGTTAEVKGGTRRLNHESIAQVEGVSSKNPSLDFMKKTGAVRVDFERGAAYSIGIPSFDAAAMVAAHAKGQFTLHIDGADGELIGRKTLQNASPLAIATFYDSPTKPETGSLFSDEELGPRVKDGQGLLFERDLPSEGKGELQAWLQDYTANGLKDIERLNQKASETDNPGLAAAARRMAEDVQRFIGNAKAVVDHFLAGNPLVVYEDNWGGKPVVQYGILHRSSREPGYYQFSEFDERGPFTHIGPGTIAELMPEILQYGFKPAPSDQMLFEPDDAQLDLFAQQFSLFDAPAQEESVTPAERIAAPGELDFSAEAGGSIESHLGEAKKPSRAPKGYQEVVNWNFAQMGTKADEWKPVEIIGETPEKYPIFRFPDGYKPAPTALPATNGDNGWTTCELCGHPIKKAYHLQHDGKKLLLMVGSECFAHGEEGALSGDAFMAEKVKQSRRETFERARAARNALRGIIHELKQNHGDLYESGLGVLKAIDAAIPSAYRSQSFARSDEPGDAVVTKAVNKGIADLLTQAQDVWKKATGLDLSFEDVAGSIDSLVVKGATVNGLEAPVLAYGNFYAMLSGTALTVLAEEKDRLKHRYQYENQYGGYAILNAITGKLVKTTSSLRGALNIMRELSSQPTILFEEEGTLAVLHNIDSGLIARVEEFGGLPMPSLAVTRPDIDFLQFGDATLIADPQVARDAMAEGRLWDRDIWSPTVPSPEWKVNRKLLTAFDARWGKAGREVGDYAGIESLYASDYEGGAARFADKIENYSATRYLYLKEHGIVIEPIMRPKVPDSDLPIEAALEVKKYLDAHPGDGGDYVAEHVEAVKELLAAYAVQYVKERGLEDLDGLDDPSDRFSDHLAERWTEGNAPYALMRFAREYDPAAMVVNKGATFEALVEALKGREEDYRTWLYDQLAPIYSNPTIKVGRGKVPFNADSVVDWMLSRSDRASQDTMTFGPAKAAALAARPFRSREEVRGEEGRLVSTEASGAFYDDKIEPLTKRLQEALPPLYRYDNTWDALDSIYKAIGAYLKKGVAKPSSERMRSSLSAAGFSRVPGAVLADAVELAHLMADRPQDYYEAKPAKVLHLDDFKVAVIPATTPAASRAALAEAGVEVYEYKEGSDRAALVRKALSEHSYTLFESEGDYRYKSEDVLTAKLQGPMPGPQILKMLRGSGVKEEELHWTGLDAYLAEDAKRTPQEVKDYLEANKLKIRERTYGDNIEHRPGKYSTYRLSGGENYTELLFVLDKKGSYYRSSHWVEPNVLAHSRFDERTLNDGRRALFLEEIQSDWHQKGRRIGYRGNADTEGWTATPGEGDIASGPTWDVRDARGHFILGVPVENGMTAEMAIERAANSDRGPDGSKVFPAPLSKTWHEFVFRRMLREAAERGFDALAWTTGEQQAERYDLSKQINSIGYVKRGEDLYRLAVWGKNDENIYRNDSVSTSEMEDIVGKEMTQKIVNGEGRKEDFFTYLVDLDLKVGGEGMKGFYDKILVDYANKLGKRWGAAVKLEEFTREREDTHGNIVEDAYTVHSLPITPEMSRSVCEEGTMLFETVEEAANAVQDELYARDIEYSVRFSRSSLSRYYSFTLGDRLYTVRVSDHPKPPSSARWGYSDFSVNTKHTGELEAFREWINELAGERKFAGKMLFEYVGENANLDEQERADLEIAKEMFLDGKDGETIRLATGWFQGKYDGKWRKETNQPLKIIWKREGISWKDFEAADPDVSTISEFIAKHPDHALSLQWQAEHEPNRKIEPPEINLDEFIEAPELFHKYPDFHEIKVRPYAESGNTNGSFGPGFINLNSARSITEIERTLTHEIQHAIQAREGFARGSSPNEFIDEYRKLKRHVEELNAAMHTALNQGGRAEYEALIAERQSLVPRINQLMGKSGYVGLDLYSNTAGEIEARDVASRLNLSPEERRAQAPYSSEEIAYEDAVVLFEDEEDPKPIPPPEPDPFAENRGRFTETMGKPGELEAFLKALWERMKGDYDPAAGEEKAPRPKSEVEKRLASHPFVLGAAITVGKNGQALAPSVRRAVLGTIRKNELAVKELAAEVLKNQDLAQEARLERESITGPAEIKNPRMRKYDEMTLAERTAILNRIRDEKIRAKIDSEGLSDRDIAEYIGRLEEDRQKLEQKEKALEHGKEKNEGLWEALHSARQEARMQTRMVAAEIRAMYRLRDMREKLITEILTPPPKGMRYEEKSKIRLIQEYLRAKKWEIERTEKGGYRKTGRIVEPAVLSMQFAHLFRETPELAQILTQNVVNKINDLPLSDWSVSDLAALNNAIDALLRQGIMAYAQKEAFRRKVEFEKRQEIANSFRRTAGYHAPMASGSDEERELVKKLDTHHLGSFTTINMDRFARYFMDKGNPDLPNWHLLVDEERDHYREKMGNVERRLGTLTNYIREKGIAPKDLYRKITVEKAGTGDSTATWTASDLMMFMLALRNEDSRKAVVFGNLFSEEERKTWPPDSLKAMASPRVNALMRAIQTELTQDEKGLAELIAADFNREFDRLNKAVISMTEEDLAKVDNYVPIKRIGEFFEQYSDEIVQDLFARNGISSRAGPKKGFTKRRTKIGPGNQTPIRLDLWGTFLDAVDKQEHLIAYGEYHRKLRNVYASRQSGEVTEALKHTLGKQGLDYLNRYIAEVANPVEYKDRDYSERLVRILRGNLSIGYLAFRWSSVANQLITSPLPYLAYAPGNLFGAAGQALANPRRFVEEVEAMSIILRQRQADPTYSQYKYLNREGWEGVVKAIGETGMKGLVLADRWSVAIGWKAVYDKAISQGLSDEEAVKQADDITLKCQPSARGVDLSPLFRDNNEWKRVVTQFGTQLNIIWQQFAFDMPNAVKERRFGEAVGILTAMGLAGMGLGALRKLRGKDDDEDDTWWNDWLFYALSQGTDSVPLIGSLITDEMKHLITGKKPYRDSDVFPVVGSILSAVDGIAEGKAKGVKDLAEAIGLVVGLPVQAVEDYLGWLIDQIMGE